MMSLKSGKDFKNIVKILWMGLAAFAVMSCSVVGKSDVEEAPYTVLVKGEKQAGETGAIEVRRYDRLVLVSASMPEGLDGKKNKPFRQLFKYITGSNAENNDIPMTAPVFMEEQGAGSRMSFVLPEEYTLSSAPQPSNPDIVLEEITDYVVAVITFNGTLSEDNIMRNKQLLEQWIAGQSYQVTGQYSAAGYNPPFTLPSFRRNEVLIPVEINE